MRFKHANHRKAVMAKLRVHIPGTHRKSFMKDVEKGPGVKMERIEATHVKGYTKLVPDKGKKGRGPKVIPTPLKKGSLGFKLKGVSQKTINRKALALAKKKGEKQVAGKLRAIQVYDKRDNKTISRKAGRAARYVYKNIGEYHGKA